MVKESEILCVIFYDDLKYEKLAENAFISFKRFHPNVDTVLVTDKTYRKYKSKTLKKFSPGIMKYAIGYEIQKKVKKYKKFISLGADIITLHRLDEFLDDDHYDILATLDYCYPLVQGGELLRTPFQHCNADVVCFNNFEAIPRIIEVSIPYTRYKNPVGDAYSEQAGLNIVMRDNEFSWRIVDAPGSNVFLNVSAKKVPIGGYKPGQGLADILGEYFVQDNSQIVDLDGNVMKLWHYCEGFGERPNQEVQERIVEINNYFSDDVKSFMGTVTAGHYFE